MRSEVTPEREAREQSQVTHGAAEPAQSGAGGCASAIAEVEPQAVAVTYWVDPVPSPKPYTLTIRFAGTRIGIKGSRQPRDRFEKIEQFHGIAAARGPVAVTTRVSGLNAGQWRVTATPIKQDGADDPYAPDVKLLSHRTVTARTRYAPLVQGPGVRLPSWPTLVGVGAIVAIALQTLLLARENVSVLSAVALSLFACVVGVAGAKGWWLGLHRKHPRHFMTAGACIQGFLVGAFAVVLLGAAIFQLPVGTLLDATAPGVFLGMAIGRPGCFLTGCCAGRPTSSKWGLWSSDRRIAIRRFPVQLVEAAMALLIGLVALYVVLQGHPTVRGAVFVGAIAIYTFGRQLLFPLRSESRTKKGRVVTMAACAMVFVADVAVLAIA
ncbi:prolipoprotein diacylglyceryl transferase [Saccharopolyspora sp. ID03-671]|uniref:prolipoprotein diacylglyceryl transferase n=1 Tax=Saccharopolyspora sp. ID03-671 TaxID=3073066 RepID=UPI0032532C17